jgi:hypothetical protein
MDKQYTLKQRIMQTQKKVLDSFSNKGSFYGLIVGSFIIPLLIYLVSNNLIANNIIMILASVFSYQIYLHIAKHNDILLGDIYKTSYFLAMFYMLNMILLSMLIVSWWLLIPAVVGLMFEMDILGKSINMDNIKNIY